MLLEGIDTTITKTATLVPEFLDEDVHIIRPLQFHTQVKINVWRHEPPTRTAAQASSVLRLCARVLACGSTPVTTDAHCSAIHRGLESAWLALFVFCPLF